jgi:hypothetical protein
MGYPLALSFARVAPFYIAVDWQKVTTIPNLILE